VRHSKQARTSKAGFSSAVARGLNQPMSRRGPPTALPADRVVVDSSGGLDELLSNLTLSRNELIDDLTVGHEQLLERVMR